MPIRFNPIACILPLVAAAELEVAGRVMGKILPDAIQCPACRVQYSVIVSSAEADAKLVSTLRELSQYVRQTCGRHPPIIQKT